MNKSLSNNNKWVSCSKCHWKTAIKYYPSISTLSLKVATKSGDFSWLLNFFVSEQKSFLQKERHFHCRVCRLSKKKSYLYLTGEILTKKHLRHFQPLFLFSILPSTFLIYFYNVFNEYLCTRIGWKSGI